MEGKEVKCDLYFHWNVPVFGAELYGGTDVNAAGNEYVSGLKLYYV